MKADATTPGNCKLAQGSLATTSNDLADDRVVKNCIQRDYVIATRRRPFCQPDGRHSWVTGLYWTKVCTIGVHFNRITLKLIETQTGPEKVCIKQVSITTGFVLMKFYCASTASLPVLYRWQCLPQWLFGQCDLILHYQKK